PERPCCSCTARTAAAACSAEHPAECSRTRTSSPVPPSRSCTPKRTQPVASGRAHERCRSPAPEPMPHTLSLDCPPPRHYLDVVEKRQAKFTRRTSRPGSLPGASIGRRHASLDRSGAILAGTGSASSCASIGYPRTRSTLETGRRVLKKGAPPAGYL